MHIYVDFNTMMSDPEERVYINTDVQPDIANHLYPGLLVILYDEDLEVDATVEFDAAHKRWQARPDWSTSRDLLPSAVVEASSFGVAPSG